MSLHTCISCSVKFANADLQRDHYKSDWHRYNLKRRIASLPPVTAEEFQNRIVQQKEILSKESQSVTFYCNACRKKFSTEKAHVNHLKSKKHEENELLYLEDNENKEITTTKVEEVNKIQSQMVVEDEHSSDEWEEIGDTIYTNTNCLFCDETSENIDDNLAHMSVAHSFFVPDVEYCTDLEGLLDYLIEKVTNDFICLWCNDKGKTFYSIDSVRKHMRDKGHCKMLHEGIALAEYADFYDYSSTYPDHEEGMDIDEEFEPDLLEGDEYQLVLPSGAVIGHRSLLRYYKQHLNPERQLTLKKSDRKLHSVLSQYKSLGWKKEDQAMIAQRAKDIHKMKRLQAKWSMQLGCKSNKLQKHFRKQNP